MSETVSTTSEVAERYAGALFELARDGGSLDAVAADIGRFEALMADSADLVRLVRSPVFTPDDQGRAVSAVLQRAGIGGLVANFVKLAARNRRLFAVPAMFKAYRALLAAHRGETTAEVTSAAPLGDTELAELKAALGAKTGKTVNVNVSVDPSLIGGSW